MPKAQWQAPGKEARVPAAPSKSGARPEVHFYWLAPPALGLRNAPKLTRPVVYVWYCIGTFVALTSPAKYCTKALYRCIIHAARTVYFARRRRTFRLASQITQSKALPLSGALARPPPTALSFLRFCSQSVCHSRASPPQLLPPPRPSAYLPTSTYRASYCKPPSHKYFACTAKRKLRLMWYTLAAPGDGLLIHMFPRHPLRSTVCTGSWPPILQHSPPSPRWLDDRLSHLLVLLP